MRWRRRVEAALRSVGLTFTQWLVLDAARELTEERDDAVSQKEIAAHVQLDEATISQVMRNLDDKHLVSRGIDFYGKAWRIFLDDRAERMLRDVRNSIEVASSQSASGSLSRTVLVTRNNGLYTK